MKKPYLIPVNKIAQSLKIDLKDGLTEKEAKQRLNKYGPNKLPEGRRESLLQIFIRQFKSPLIYVLLAAAIIAFFVSKNQIDGFVIMAIVILNSIIGTIQEGRAQTTLAQLKKFLSSTCLVLRDGEQKVIETENLVPGDIIVVQEGDQIPADARTIEVNSIKIDESILTGESVSVAKTLDPLDNDAPIHDQKNMLFKGTNVLSGNAKAIVVSTGLDTQIGRIHKSIESTITGMPLQQKLNQLSYWIIAIVLIECIFLLIIGLWREKTLGELLFLLVTLFVSSIPEGLIIVLTVVLAIGTYRMVKKNMLVKKLQAAEGLGRTDVIIVDKTGTLTRNEMSVLSIYTDDNFLEVTGQGYIPKGQVLDKDKAIEDLQNYSKLSLLADGSILLNRSIIHYKKDVKAYQVKGEPLEAALYVFAQKLKNPDTVKSEYTNLFDIPFNPETRMHIAGYKKNESIYIFALGAPEVIADNSTLSKEEYKKSQDALQKLLDKGLRTLGLAYIKLNKDEIKDFTDHQKIQKQVLGKLNFLGFFGIQDSIREDVKPVMKEAQSAGLNIIMATGDHKKTAEYVALKTGIISNIDKDTTIEGDAFKTLSDQELIQALKTVKVFARVSPENKIRIADLLQKKGKTVAMTGDGVNDAPALAKADLGIAMGISGTEVAQQASDLVLLDDSFSSIVLAIEEGRHIFYTMRRVILYLFATNFGEILIIFVAILARLPLPLLPTQILWLNLVTDGFMDKALALEPKEKKLLHKKWLKKVQDLGLIDKNMILKILFMATIMTIGSILLFSFSDYQHNIDKARTIVLTVMAFFQWFNAWNCRSETVSTFTKGLLSNKWIILASIIVLLLQIAIVYVPFMQFLFHTTALRFNDWIVIAIISSSILIAEEIRKYIVSKIS